MALTSWSVNRFELKCEKFVLLVGVLFLAVIIQLCLFRVYVIGPVFQSWVSVSQV